ncbi:MAG: 50S ribosomal protein L6 [Candidatus Woesebacteria bacterium GW2011_GWA1_45_8]|uniref:Large ribosomal subunit protein uL6 n=1 Tax=Candidatus Woesebacteria bacterium GW2011_GWA1_45_8 TaxID=1618559 RepID=A0A0G1Q3P9_9BACT|nr:MAG: 50S ribosomal protein L6 [Candidatus Woesebacteria bacterium GW2011_GWA1_45_8]
MSKIGKLPVTIPEGVTAQPSESEVKISGPKGSLTVAIPRKIEVNIRQGQLIVTSQAKSKQGRSNYGSTRAHIANAVKGVSEGFKKQLELVGTGFRAEVAGKTLTMLVGYSHPVKSEAPEGINFTVVKSIITVEGASKELVGQIAANIRAVRPPEPYKGKGIKYMDEVIRRKAGKAAKTVTGAAA